MIKKITLLILLFLFAFVQVKGQSLEEYLYTAAENNPALKAKHAEFEAALQKVAQVNSLPDPNLSIGVFISPVETRVGPQQAKIGLSQMFPWFGTLKTAGSVYEKQAEAKYQEFLQKKFELFKQVKTAWYPLYEVKQKIKLEQENFQILQRYKQLATTSYKNGKSSMVDVIRVDIMMENAETDIELLKDELKPLNVRFNKLLNREDSLNIEISDTLKITPSIDNYRKDSLLLGHPVLASFELRQQSAEQSEELSKKQGMPKFGVGIDYVFVGKREGVTLEGNGKDVIMPMVNISIPIFRSKYNAAIKEAQFQQEAINYNKQEFENQLTTAYEDARFELEKSKKLVFLYDEQIDKTQQAITLLMKSYSNSGNEFEEILRMQQELLKYRMKQVTAIKNFHIALANIDYLTSKYE